MIGVTVIIEGTSTGTVTDYNGNFTLQASAEDRLKLSFVGYQNQFLNVSDRTHFDVVMVSTVTSLDEVIFVGYGRLEKASVVGAISQGFSPGWLPFRIPVNQEPMKQIFISVVRRPGTMPIPLSWWTAWNGP